MKIGSVKVSPALNLDFALLLATIGHVKILTDQISLTTDWSELKFDSLKLPPNCRIEWIVSNRTVWSERQSVTVMFRFVDPPARDMCDAEARDRIETVAEAIRNRVGANGIRYDRGSLTDEEVRKILAGTA